MLLYCSVTIWKELLQLNLYILSPRRQKKHGKAVNVSDTWDNKNENYTFSTEAHKGNIQILVWKSLSSTEICNWQLFTWNRMFRIQQCQLQIQNVSVSVTCILVWISLFSTEICNWQLCSWNLMFQTQQCKFQIQNVPVSVTANAICVRAWLTIFEAACTLVQNIW